MRYPEMPPFFEEPTYLVVNNVERREWFPKELLQYPLVAPSAVIGCSSVGPRPPSRNSHNSK